MSTTPANSNEVTEGDVLTVEEAALFLRVGRNQVYEAVGRGDLPHGRIGKTIRFSRAALVRWLDRSCETASAKGI